MMWIESYKNHIIYSSMYIAIIAASFSALCSSPSTSTSTTDSDVLFSGTSFLWFLICILALLCLFSELKYVYLRLNLPPGDSGYPIVGNFFHVIQVGALGFKLDGISKFKSSIFTMNFLMKPYAIMIDDDDVKWAITQERKGHLVPRMASHLRTLMGKDAMLFQTSIGHRRLRKIFEPTFSPMAVQSYMKIIDDTVQSALEEWSIQNIYMDSSKQWATLAMRIFFCVCGVAVVDNDDQDQSSPANANNKTIMDKSILEKLSGLFNTWSSGFGSLVPYALPGNCLYKALQAQKELDKLLQTLIDDFKQKNPIGSPGANDGMLGRLCYGIDDDGNTLTDRQLITNVRFILFAGHDTTKGSLSSICHYLIQQPKMIHDLLMEEVQTYSNPLDFEQLKSAPLLNAFLAEVWRLVPPLGGHGTEAVVDLDHPKGYKIRRGVLVAMDIQASYVANEDRYPNPFEFHVERWLPPGHKLHDPKYYVKDVDYNTMSVKYRAFNMGQHSCLGGHLAKVEARIVLARLLQQYDIEIRNEKLVPFPLRHYRNEFKLSKK